ncbi:MAG: cytochrome C biogenesis protein [Algibacter sp.]
MKNIFALLFLVSTLGFSQIVEPVKWKTSVEKVSSSAYILTIQADIIPEYHLYALNVKEGGPLPTVFIFNENENYELVGEMEEDKGHTVFEPVFEMMVKYFENVAVFKQKIRLKNKT